MFTNKSFDTVGFDSQVSVAKSEVSANVQTTEIVYSSNQVQTVEKRSMETQTVQEEKKIPSIDYNSLATFLKRITPEVLNALDEPYNTFAYTTTNTSENLQLLKKLSITEESEKKKISDLSCNLTGSRLAVSYIDTSHSPYLCNHPNKIQLYDITLQGISSDAPKRTFEINSCVTAMSYNPAIESILGVGLANGNVQIWCTRDGAIDVPINSYPHGDSVSHVCWNTMMANGVYLLASSSKDGYILFHRLMPDFTTCLYRPYKIILNNKPEVGQWITTFDFSWEDPTLFIVGTLNGGIYKCSLRMSPVESA